MTPFVGWQLTSHIRMHARTHTIIVAVIITYAHFSVIGTILIASPAYVQ